MFAESETFLPMAPADSVPRICRRYHYEHFPQPTDPVELMEDLHRGLRGVPNDGFWSKVKSAGWRFLVYFSNGGVELPPRSPAFPVAPPSSPVPRARKISPDIHIYPVGRPEFVLSPPLPQEDGFLFVPSRSSRSVRARRRERLPPSPRPLPTPPGPPSCAIPKILCCPWENSPSTSSSSSTSSPSSTPSPSPTSSTSSSSSADSDMNPEEIDQARFFAEITPYLFLPDENSSSSDEESKDLDTPGPSMVALSSNKVPTESEPKPAGDAITMSGAQTEEVRAAAADRRFLEELGLTPQTFMLLLDGTDIEWDDDDSDSDEADED